MIRVALVRGKYLNQFEGQNFNFSKSQTVQLTGISSQFPLHDRLPFKTKKFLSLADIADNRITRFIANRTIGDLQILFGLEQEVGNFDIFHTADPHYYYSYQLAKLRHKGKINLLLSTVWETIPFNNESTHAKRIIKQFTTKNTDFFICPTQKAKDALIREGITSKRIILLPFGVNLDRFTIKRKKRNEIVILFVGRLVEEKGVKDLFNAYKRIDSNLRKRTKLKMTGDGALKDTLKQRIKKEGLDSFVSIENNPYKKMPRVYQSADIMVIPSKTTKTWEEQFGMVAVEALASGLPIIAYSSGALHEVISEAGIFLKEDDTGGLSNILTKLIKDDQLRLRLGKIARRRAEKNFDSKKVSAKHKLIYETLGRNTFQK